MRRIIPVILVFALVFIGIPELATAQSACGSTFVVRPGDTFSGIATICGVSITGLLAANPWLLYPNLIYPGQVFTIPNGSSIPVTGGPSTYTVVYGDTMWSISRRYNVSFDALAAANPAITDTDRIYPGQVINIPAAGDIPVTGGPATYYTVAAGDTLFRIATRYGTSVNNLLILNPWITNENFILPGWVIRIT